MKVLLRALLVRIDNVHKEPWWWKHIQHDPTRCQLDYATIPLSGGKIASLVSIRFLGLLARSVKCFYQVKRKYDYILTFECGWESFLIAFIQTVTLCRRPRHVILQFIMRERTSSLQSRIKYLLMKWCFSSVYLCICSSRAECHYYADVFSWPADKLEYVPLHTDPSLFEKTDVRNDGFVISAGRTLRDYGTLLTAFKEMRVPLLIVASPTQALKGVHLPHARVMYDLPGPELIELLSRSLLVVLPLEDRKISIGQSVLLQAMTMGKAVVVSKVSGTEDYVEHMKTGVLVPPYDPEAICRAISMLIADEALREMLGRAAQERVRKEYLPSHYAASVARLLRANDA